MDEINIIQPCAKEVFQDAIDKFQALVEHLRSDTTQHLEHGDIEVLIKQDGTEVLRCLLQGYLDLRTHSEPKPAYVIGKDGVSRSHKRSNCTRTLMSLFGEVDLRRMRYSKRDRSSVHPMDEALNLPPDKYSHGLREMVLNEASQHSFDEVVANIDRNTGGHIGKRQVEALTAEISQDYELFYQRCSNDDNEAAIEEESMLLVMSMDSKGIVMRQEDLREATKKAAENECHKLKSRLSRGEKRNRKRMATVATLYDVKPHQRSAEAIMGKIESTTECPKIAHKRVWASVSRTPAVVTEELFTDAERRLGDEPRACVMLVDGDVKQLKRIENQMTQSKLKPTIIIDFIHVLEYLWKAAYCFHAEGSEAAQSWVQYKALEILNGNVSHSAAGMRRSATLQNLTEDERKAVDTCANYLLKLKDKLRYDEYLAKGYPIATGVIEGACRHLIKDRMDITGARWRLKGSESVLKLRSLRSSGDALAYFKFYKEQSHKRCYGTDVAANFDNYDMEKAV